MTSEPLFIWIYLPDQSEPVVAGRLHWEAQAGGVLGRFVYGQSYLGRHDAVPLDPVSLPLGERPLTFSTLRGFPGVVMDACPDRWGMRVIDRLHGPQIFPQGYLLQNDPGRAGNLGFSRQADQVPQEPLASAFKVEDLLAAALAVEQNQPADPRLLQALQPGTGGARPKCNLLLDGACWIVKFPSISDPAWVSMPKLEFATMNLACLCGVEAAETRLLAVAGREVCLVRRFDRRQQNPQGMPTLLRRGFLSARSVFYADPGYAQLGTGSYARLARWLPRFGGKAEERAQVFRRMVFNALVRNSDDHELNHGLLQEPEGHYRLAPAYDIVPSLTRHRIHHHALLLGDSAAGTLTNLLAHPQAFGLDKDDAAEIVRTMQQTIREHWQEVLYQAGCDDAELRRLEFLFAPLPTGE